MASPTLAFAPLDGVDFDKVTSVCIGTGRFLRAVLVPALTEVGGGIILAQTRGTSFGTYLANRPDRSYEVDTVLQHGAVVTLKYPVAACGSLGIPEGRAAFLQLPTVLPHLRYVGLGLTEAGIVHNGQSIIDLAEFLHACFIVNPKKGQRLSVVNTDNLPFNGDAVRDHVCSCDFSQNVQNHDEFLKWMKKSVRFHNTMVDRITSHREGVPEVPRAEPLPEKALVIEDLTNALPPVLGSVPGVVIRTQPGQLAVDIQMKLRIANGLHTAMVYAMALGRLFRTDCCVVHQNLLSYLEQLFERDIVHGCAELNIPRLQLTPVFNEWMSRLQHPHFGLGCFFVCQNAIQKMGIRLLPSVKAKLAAGEEPSAYMVFALACMLRFLTPFGPQPRLGEQPPVFMGRLDHEEGNVDPSSSPEERVDDSFEYVPGLSVHPQDGTYEFKDGDGIVPLLLRQLTKANGSTVAAAISIAGEVLCRVPGFEIRSVPAHADLAAEVGHMLHRMLQGDAALLVLEQLRPQRPLYLSSKNLEEAVREEIEAAEAIDVHTHLFSAAHGRPLMKYGIDDMLTYHYLVSQYLSSSSERPKWFYSMSTAEQAECVWVGLFVNASPLAEPCRGVLTTLKALGLGEELESRDLDAIRSWYAGQDPDMFNEKVMRLARLQYVVTSHDPFEPAEADSCLDAQPQAPRYRSAISVDKLLEDDWEAVCKGLDEAGEPRTPRGVINILQRCAAKMKPVFVTAATPHDFAYNGRKRRGRDEDEVNTSSNVMMDFSLDQCVPGTQEVIDDILIPFCKNHNLPLSLRMGTRRGVNPDLRLAGDGMGSAQLGSLEKLCRAHPRVKFMATVLGKGDQHQAAVLANKFNNLHIWGCWWYCNNPSICKEVTALRLEMLGTNFTFQASSARVHDQLIYKWIHAREQLAQLLTSKYGELMATGWKLSRGEIRRDVQRLLGGSFEEFLAKEL